MITAPFTKVFKSMNLKQEPPRVRTVMTASIRSIRLAFPWVTIGHVPLMAVQSEDIARYIAVFFHNEPWRNLAHAVEIFRIAPEVFHTLNSGLCCCGPYAESLYKKDHVGVRPTPSEVFWNTSVEDQRHNVKAGVPKVMLDIANPQRVLKHAWEDVNWRNFLYYFDRENF